MNFWQLLHIVLFVKKQVYVVVIPGYMPAAPTFFH